MRSYQKFRVVIIAQFMCTALLAQSLKNDDLEPLKDQPFYTSNSIEIQTHTKLLKNRFTGNSRATFLNSNRTAACKNSSEKSPFSISHGRTSTKSINNLTTSLYEILSSDNNAASTLKLSSIIKNEEKVVNPLSAGIRRVIHPKCHGTSTGSIKARASGGTKPYQYLWSNGNTTSEITGIPAGTYTVSISDADGNLVVDMTTLTEPPPLQLEIISNSPSCTNVNDGTALFHASGGTPFPYKKSLYTTLWSNAKSKGIMFDISTNTKITLSNISIHLPGTYLQTISIYLKSGSMVGHEFDSTQWQLINTTQLMGAGIDVESIIPIVNGPVLTPGLYSLYVYNHQGEIYGFKGSLVGNAFNHGHILTVFEGISRDTSASPFQSSIGQAMNLSGRITYEVNNDYGFAYNNNFPDGQWFQKQLSSGQHLITMNDALGCTLTQPFTIPAADSIKIISEILKSPRCSNTNDGEIKLMAQPANTNHHSMTTVATGNPAYGSMLQVNATQDILLKGFELFLNRSGIVSIYIKSGKYTGSESNATSWSSLGTYSMNKSVNSSITQVLLNNSILLTSGDWSIYVYSGDDILNQLDSISFYDTYALSYLKSSTRVGSSGAFTTLHKNGSFWAGNIIYTDPGSNIQFNWSNQSNQSHLTQLSGGLYQCTLLQDNGCSITKNYSIPSPPPLIVKETIIPEVDYEQNGSAGLQVSGGTAPYYVQWLNSGQTGNQLNQLAEGPQPYFISDANGCILNDTLYVSRMISPTYGQGTLTIAPNPGKGHIRVMKEVHGMEECELSIFDFAGRLIFNSTTSISKLMQTGLDIGQFADGYYFIVVRDEDQVFQAKANVTR